MNRFLFCLRTVVFASASTIHNLGRNHLPCGYSHRHSGHMSNKGLQLGLQRSDWLKQTHIAQLICEATYKLRSSVQRVTLPPNIVFFLPIISRLSSTFAYLSMKLQLTHLKDEQVGGKFVEQSSILRTCFTIHASQKYLKHVPITYSYSKLLSGTSLSNSAEKKTWYIHFLPDWFFSLREFASF